MDYQKMKNERDMLDGCLNRMFITNDAEELERLYNGAQQRLEVLFNASTDRIKEKKYKIDDVFK